MTRKELIREIIKKNGYHLDGDYTRNISKPGKAIDKKLDLWVYKTLKKANLSKDEIKGCFGHDVELWFTFNFYVNSAGNQCGQYKDVDLRIDDKYIKTIFTTYDDEYARKWCR